MQHGYRIIDLLIYDYNIIVFCAKNILRNLFVGET